MLESARTIAAVLVVAFAALPAGARAADPPASPPNSDPKVLADFENQVRPLLAAKCLKCHGPRKQESSLRLDGRAAMMQGGDSGPAIVPGKPDESLLVKAVRHEGDIQMPPGAKLKEEQIATLSRWIADGAPWPDEARDGVRSKSGLSPSDRSFWSLRPLAHPPAPEVRDRAWCRSPVDRWILADLEARGLRPVGPAEAEALIRRATYDLTGLPPSVEEIDAFLADTSPDPFAKVVDRLLASPAYGERWGRHWLDVVRYADTAGETADYPVREAYRYRNYVIDAFNRDLPYDEFVREQVAGDLLAEEDPRDRYADRVAATGFLALSRRFGFDSENYHHLTIQDTIDTLGQSFLGLTLGCARCHDHKFDPVSTRDYYALYGIFDSTRYPFPGSEQKSMVRAMAPLRPRAESERLREAYARELAAVEAELEALKAPRPRIKIRTLDDIDGDFELQAVSAGGSTGAVVPPWAFEGRPEAIAQAQSPFTNAYPRVGTVGIRFPNDAGAHRIWQRLWPSRTARSHSLLYVNIDFRNEAGGQGTYRFTLGHGPGRSPAVEVFANGESLWVRDGDSPESIRRLRPDTWYNLRLTLDLAHKTFSGSVGAPGDMTDFSGKGFSTGWDGTIDCVTFDGQGPIAGIRPAHDVDNVVVRDTPIDPVATSPHVSPAPGSSPEVRRAELERRYADLIANGPTELAYAVAEGTPHDARIQKRGEPDRPGDLVPRRFLEILGGDPLPPDAEGSGRRALARWLTRPENPLLARVMVNRIWKSHFGNGLVRTENDFGRRGDPPTHPALLDDLAGRFIASGWSIKAMHRLIMFSSTYRLSSEHDDRAAATDPDDRLLWRFPRRRLDAESIRDAMLALGGNLDRTPGGAHPFPPVGAVFTQHGPFNAVYETDRRSVYLMTQRIKRHPYFALFDGADPNASTPRRAITTVPTQSLFFMNDPFVHAQAAGLAGRLLAVGGDDAGRLRLAYRMALGREPLDGERESARTFLDRYRDRLRAEGIPAERHAAMAWSALARTLFASNEFLFID